MDAVDVIHELAETGSLNYFNMEYYLHTEDELSVNCDMSKRFSNLHNTHGMRSKHTVRFLIPAIGIFGGRSIVSSQKQSELFSQPSLWFSTRHQYFLNDYQTFVGLMVENGLLSVFTEAFETVLQDKILKEVDVSGGSERHWNYFTYASELMKNGGINVFKKLTVNLQDIWVVFLLFFWLTFACSLSFVYEVLERNFVDFKNKIYFNFVGAGFL